jgi:hypothetical protein
MFKIFTLTFHALLVAQSALALGHRAWQQGARQP